MSGRHEPREDTSRIQIACSRDFCTGVADTSRHTSFGWKAACPKHHGWLAALPAVSAVTQHEQQQ